MKTINFLDSRTPEERKGELKPVTTFAQFSNMKTIKDIEKEFDKKWGENPYTPTTLASDDFEARKYMFKSFLEAKINEVIDEMIGEERKVMDFSKKLTEGGGYPEPQNIGYNQKVSELKDFKKKFNE